MQSQGYSKLRSKLFLVILAFSLVPLFALSLFMHLQFSRTYNDKIQSNLEIVVENKRKGLDMFLEERVAQLRSLASTHSFNELSDNAFLNNLFLTVQAGSKSFVDFGVIDQKGDHVAYAGPYALRGVNYKDEEWFHEVMLKGLYISNVFMGFRKFPHFIIAVMRREAGRSWILRATIDSDVFDSLVKTVQVGQGGDAYLVNDKGVLQTSSRFAGRVLDKCAFPDKVEAFSGVRIRKGETAGREIVAGMAWLQETDWLLVVSEDPTEGVGPLLRTQSIMVILAFLGIGVIMTGTYLVTKSIIVKLIRADREKASLDASLMQSSKMAALGKLAAGVAHEVNNPLTMIRESAGWIKDLLVDEDPKKINNFDEIEKSLNKIEYHVDRAKAVTHRMLGFGRRMEPMQENVSLNMLTDQTVQFLENEALHRNIHIDKDLCQGLPEITTDSAQVQQVLLNILENAIDAVGRDGNIRIRTALGANSREVLVSVSDTGPGIPEDKLSRIFDPFYTTKPVGEGTGLGLAITYSILQKIGGRIEVESSPGQGSTFMIYLPLGR
ncbi:MAG: two-component sensor histidine kinase [Desulfovibrionaceae bacterium]|nr:two-component sensor histidine kinase [Desulfovibrionaceae bacterium]